MAAVTSTTTTDSSGNRHQEISPALLNVLDDYTIHQSPLADESIEPPGETITVAGTRRQRQPRAFDPTLAPHPRVPFLVTNPTWWEDTYRRVPDYRPLNRELDMEERRQNVMFQIVGRVMVFGCMTIASSAWVWRNTMGEFTDIGLGKVGGEW